MMKSGMGKQVTAASAGLLLLGTQTVWAAEGHSDINFAVEDEQLVIESDGPVDASTGYFIFEGDFGDLFGGPYETKNPGFANAHDHEGEEHEGEEHEEHEHESLLPDSLLGVRGLSVLEYWDGSSWSTADVGALVTVEDALSSLISFSAAGVSNPEGYIDQADAEGGIHAHLTFAVNDTALDGAYMLTLQLFGETSLSDDTAPYADSDPFLLILNKGLTEELFEAGVDARIAPVPLPAGLLLLGSALGALGLRARKSHA